jgi:hypothetical protein
MRWHGPSALWAGLIVVPACSARPQAAGLDPPRSSRVVAPSNTRRSRNACGLIPKASADSILGSELTPVAVEVGSAKSTCRYSSNGGGGFVLTVFWSGGRAEWQAIRAGLSLGKRASGGGDPELDAGTLKSLVPVPGLGQEAWASDLLGGYVLREDVLLTFSFGATRLPGNWTELARRALAGLEPPPNPPLP